LNDKPELTFRKVSPNEWRSNVGCYEIRRAWKGILFFVGRGAQGLPDAKTFEEAQQIAREDWAKAVPRQRNLT
jgi:hypothetical protein